MYLTTRMYLGSQDGIPLQNHVLEIGKAEGLHFNDMKNGKQLYKHAWRFYCNFIFGSASKSHFTAGSPMICCMIQGSNMT